MKLLNIVITWLLLICASLVAAEPLQGFSENSLYKIQLLPAEQPIAINRIQRWKIKIQTVDGAAVEDARFVFDARMPEHRHGMPTEPSVEEYLGDGLYSVSGIKFSMPGNWQIKIDGSVGVNSLYAVFDLTL